MTPNFDIEKLMPTLEKLVMAESFILEIGPAQGNGSTYAFTQGIKRSKQKRKLFISVDIRDYMDIKPDLDYWRLLLGDSREEETVMAVKKLAKGRRAGIIFIDTHHTFEQMEAELKVWPEMADRDTIWLFHDTWMMGEYNHMTDAIKSYAQINGLVYEDITQDSHGLGMVYGNRRPEL